MLTFYNGLHSLKMTRRESKHFGFVIYIIIVHFIVIV